MSETGIENDYPAFKSMFADGVLIGLAWVMLFDAVAIYFGWFK